MILLHTYYTPITHITCLLHTYYAPITCILHTYYIPIIHITLPYANISDIDPQKYIGIWNKGSSLNFFSNGTKTKIDSMSLF